MTTLNKTLTTESALKNSTPKEFEKALLTSLVEDFDRQKMPWIWYKEILETFYIPYFLDCPVTFEVNELNLIQTFQKVVNNELSIDTMSSDLISLLELYKRGYVFITIRHPKNPKLKVIFSLENPVNIQIQTLPRLKFSSQCNSITKSGCANPTQKGIDWFESIRKKYPDLFKVAIKIDSKESGYTELPETVDGEGISRFQINNEGHLIHYYE